MKPIAVRKTFFIFVFVLSIGVIFSWAQPAGQMQDKLAAVKQAAAANQAALKQYQWTESMQISVGQMQRPPQQFTCRYNADGTVQKTPMGAPQQPPSGMAGKLIEEKVEQLKEYMGRVQDLVRQYVPPDPEKMEKAKAAGNVNVNTSTPGAAQLTFKNYVQDGDSMTFSFDESTKKMSDLSIDTYLDSPADAVKVTVQFGTLPDGTNYPQQTTINAAAKNLTVTTTNSNYQKAQ
jgi:hypothetical protein